MSRAFVKEQDDKPEELAERLVSPNPNVVTVRGLRLIDAEIDEARRLLANGQRNADKAAIARASRDLRYWMLRRSTAQPKTAPNPVDAVAFGTRVKIARADGRTQTFAIVGEDEADPAKGYIAYTAPLARAVMSRSVGDAVDFAGGEIEILSLEAIGPEG